MYHSVYFDMMKKITLLNNIVEVIVLLLLNILKILMNLPLLIYQLKSKLSILYQIAIFDSQNISPQSDKSNLK